MTRNHTIIAYKWKCEICGQESKKWLARWKVNRNYTVHFNRYHTGIFIQPILRRKRLEGGDNEKEKKIRKTNRRNR